MNTSSESPRPSPALSDPARSYRIASFLFLRGLGLVYVVAFASLLVQVKGLIGANGILPVAPWLEQIRNARPDLGFLELPTLCWWAASDFAILAQCGVGLLAAFALMLGWVPLPASILCWLLYLSMTVAGQLFLGYQWDALLLEVGLIGILGAPRVLRSPLPHATAIPTPVRILAGCVLFKLMFLSGAVKLLSGDPVWRGCTALEFHFWTQPLPIWTAWYMHQLPASVLKASCALMFAIELLLPFGIFGPRWARRGAVAGFILLMCLIGATGNYTYFNLLTIVLALTQLDDAVFPARWCGALAPLARANPRRHAWRWVVAISLISISLNQALRTCRVGLTLPWVPALERAIASFRTVNTYGLFAVMTQTRNELEIQGTMDGVTWVPYRCRWKPESPDDRPRIVAPHQPRLDWQFWFAALGNFDGNPWLLGLMARLLEGSPEVLSLFAVDPFAGKPPKAVRIVTRSYRFTTPDERRASGRWWICGEPQPYSPAISLRPASN